MITLECRYYDFNISVAKVADINPVRIMFSTRIGWSTIGFSELLEMMSKLSSVLKSPARARTADGDMRLTDSYISVTTAVFETSK